MVFEGIVVNKVAYKDRDLIAKVLLRSGTLGSFYIYGGQGGGKSQKPTMFEFGSMMKLNIKEAKTKKLDGAELFTVSEYIRTWEPQQLRYNIQAFYLCCLYFEIIQKAALPLTSEEDYSSSQETEGIFSVLSNALFYLDDSLKKQKFDPAAHLSLFMVKLLFHLGIMPDTGSCSYCGADLLESSGVIFQADQGQFACHHCVSGESQKGLLLRVKKAYQTRYQDYAALEGYIFNECDKLIQFFCHHFHLRPLELKSYSLLFK